MTLLVRVVLFKSARLKMERSYSCDLSIQPRCTVYARAGLTLVLSQIL
jgi:hypothetical protein